MTRIAFIAAAFLCVLSRADLKVLDSSSEFRSLVASAHVPVIVQFSAYWCGPCQQLKGVYHEVAPDYSDDQVIIAYVDADQNSDLKSYLQGGYPTTRTFYNGKLASKKFTGSQSESYVRRFIDNVIANPSREETNFCPL